MDRIKKVFSLIHLFGWLLIYPLFCWIFASEGHQNWLYIATILVIGALLVFYSHFFILTRYLNKRKFGFYFLGLLFIFVLGPLPFLLAHKGVIDIWTTFSDQYFTTLFSIVVFFILLSWVARIIQNWFTNTLKRENLEKQAIQAELIALKSQINPHFLFNTLNNIHTLAYKQAPTTPEAIMRLASLMRYMIYESNANTVPLTKEIEYLQDFISLQQLRYKKAPIVDMQIAGDTASCSIAPLLFIHLLENAYKHSSAHLEVGDIKVNLEIIRNSLTFRIQNPIGNKNKTPMPEPEGIGLANVKKRLNLLYPHQYLLEINHSEDFFELILIIQLPLVKENERKANLLYN